MFIGRTLWWLLTLPFRLVKPNREGFRKGRPFPVRVVSVQDGDSLQAVAVNRSDRRIRVRLYGIDAPEHDQDYGREARERLSSLVRGRNDLTLEYKDTDHYGRLVGVLLSWIARRAALRQPGDGRGGVSPAGTAATAGTNWGWTRRSRTRGAPGAASGLRAVRSRPWDHRRERRRPASARRSLFSALFLATVISVAVVVAFYFLRQAI